MKEKKCKECKKKPKEVVLTPEVDPKDIIQAYEYVSIASKMDNLKWDFVEDVYLQLFPSKKPVQRNCGKCLARVAKGIEYHYKQIQQN